MSALRSSIRPQPVEAGFAVGGAGVGHGAGGVGERYAGESAPGAQVGGDFDGVSLVALAHDGELERAVAE